MNARMAGLAWALTLGLSLGGCATGPNNPAFPVTSQQARDATREMRLHPKPLDRPLVVVGGFLDPNLTSPVLSHYFEGVAQKPRMVSVVVGFYDNFEDCRAAVIAAVDKAFPSSDPQWTTQVDVVGASLGGLVARYAAAPSRDPKHPRRLNVARLFTISSPLAGSTLAQAVGITQLLRDMQAGSEFQKYLAKTDPDARYKLYPYVLLDDEIVGEHYAAPPGANPYWLPNTIGIFSPHLSAMIDERILADIARHLRDETPFTAPTPDPLPKN